MQQRLFAGIDWAAKTAGAESDPGDIYVLADALRTDGHRLAPLTPDSDQTEVLRALGRTRKDLVKARVALGNQLSAQLERCFPGAAGISPLEQAGRAVCVASLARAWVRVIWRLWQDGTAYDPTKHRRTVRLLATQA